MWFRSSKKGQKTMNNQQKKADPGKPGHTYKRRRGAKDGQGLNSTSRATTVMKAMGNSQRLEILSHLINGEERTVSELEQILKTLSQSALSQHLGRLRRARILKSRRHSQMIYYSIEDENVQQIMELLTNIYDGDPVLPNKLH